MDIGGGGTANILCPWPDLNESLLSQDPLRVMPTKPLAHIHVGPLGTMAWQNRSIKEVATPLLPVL